MGQVAACATSRLGVIALRSTAPVPTIDGAVVPTSSARRARRLSTGLYVSLVAAKPTWPGMSDGPVSNSESKPTVSRAKLDAEIEEILSEPRPAAPRPAILSSVQFRPTTAPAMALSMIAMALAAVGSNPASSSLAVRPCKLTRSCKPRYPDHPSGQAPSSRNRAAPADETAASSACSNPSKASSVFPDASTTHGSTRVTKRNCRLASVAEHRCELHGRRAMGLANGLQPRRVTISTFGE